MVVVVGAAEMVVAVGEMVGDVKSEPKLEPR